MGASHPAAAAWGTIHKWRHANCSHFTIPPPLSLSHSCNWSVLLSFFEQTPSPFWCMTSFMDRPSVRDPMINGDNTAMRRRRWERESPHSHCQLSICGQQDTDWGNTSKLQHWSSYVYIGFFDHLQLGDQFWRHLRGNRVNPASCFGSARGGAIHATRPSTFIS